MQLSLVCRRCDCQIIPGDSFCQECGLEQAPVLETGKAEIKEQQPEFFSGSNSLSPSPGENSDFDWPALMDDPCPHPGPQITQLSTESFKFSNYELALEADSEPEKLINHEHGAAEDYSKSLPAAGFDGKDSKSSEQLQDNGLGLRGGKFMAFSNYAVALAVVVFLSTLIAFFYNKQEKKAKKIQEDKAIFLKQTINSSARKQDYAAIYRQLIAARILGQLNEEQRRIFDEAVYRLADKELQSGNLDKALEFFKQVSPDSKYYVRSREIIFQKALPPAKESQQKPAPRKRSGRQTRTLMPEQVLSQEQVLSIPELEELQSEEAKARLTAEQALEIESGPPVKFSESEISQYNRLLFSYFARHKKQAGIESGIKTAEKTAAENAATEAEPEPPSFREWLKSGKEKF